MLACYIHVGEHMVYRTSVHAARIEQEKFGQRPLGYPPSSFPLYNVHYTFDFAQQLTIPHHSRQEGPLYFTSPVKFSCLEFASRAVGNNTIILLTRTRRLARMVLQPMVQTQSLPYYTMLCRATGLGKCLVKCIVTIVQVIC